MKAINNIEQLKQFYKNMKKAGKTSYEEKFIKLCIDLSNYEFGKVRYCKDILLKCKNEEHAKYKLCKMVISYYNNETALNRELVKAMINSYLCKLDYDRLAKVEYEIFINR